MIKSVIHSIVRPVVSGVINPKELGRYWTQLPQKLIVTPDVLLYDFGAITGWSGYSGAIEENVTEKLLGESSLKLTTTSGGYMNMERDVAWDLSSDSGKSFGLWVYPHSAPITTFPSITLRCYTGADFFELYQNAAKLSVNVWNFLSLGRCATGGGWKATGNPAWNNITKFRIILPGAAGQIAICSFDMARHGAINKPAILLSFDDGYKTNYTKALPLLRSNNMVATAYMISDLIGTANYCTLSETQALDMAGWDVANHTKSHLHLITLNQAQIEAELNDCQTVLDNAGMTRSSKHVAYPFTEANATVLAAMAAWGAKTGRGAGVINLGCSYEIGWPYNLTYGAPEATLADTITNINENISRGLSVFLNFHELTDAQYIIFEGVVDLIKLKGYQTLTIDEYYRLYSGAITVHHK